MPIKDVSSIRRLPRLGHIRLGVKVKQGGKEYPKETDYFLLDPKTPDPAWNNALKEQFEGLYGKQPKAIEIMFPPVDHSVFFAQFYKRYGASTLVKCKGDGDMATTSDEFAAGLEILSHDDRGFAIVKCNGPECPYQKGDNEYCQQPQCARMGALQIILPRLKGMGVWQVNTGSFNSIVNINSAIDWLLGFCGRYAMIPVTLMRVPTDVQHKGKKRKHYILQIDTQRVSIGEIQAFAANKPIERALIPAVDESKDNLFYDTNGNKPRGLPGPDADKEEVEADAVPEEKKSSGPMSDNDKSYAFMNELIEAFRGLTTSKEVTEYVDVCKADGTFKKLKKDHRKQLQDWINGYNKVLVQNELEGGLL